MRLSGGTLRNRVIPVPRTSAVRPTPGRVKEALFSIVGSRIAGARVLDLYAGSGAIAFEALSRGAASAVLVEKNARQAATIRQLAADLGLAERAQVLTMDAARAADLVDGRFDFVYADPPYAMPAPEGVFTTLRERGSVDSGSTIVYERRSKGSAAFAAPGFATQREERYGEVLLQFVQALPL
jgi:16S rRNA (guanine966-N2)-methyltransferase